MAFPSRKVELFLVTLLIVSAFVIRIYKLGEFPDMFLAYEADNAQDAIRILHGQIPQNGFFGLDWTSQPAFSVYIEYALLLIDRQEVRLQYSLAAKQAVRALLVGVRVFVGYVNIISFGLLIDQPCSLTLMMISRISVM